MPKVQDFGDSLPSNPKRINLLTMYVIMQGESEAGSLNSRLDLPEDISPMDNRQETPEARDGLGASDYDQSAAVERDPEELKAVEGERELLP